MFKYITSLRAGFFVLLVCVTISIVPVQAHAVEKLFYYFDNMYGYSYFKKNNKHIDVIAPQVYTVEYNLTVSSPSSTKILREAKKNKVKIVPLLVNADFSKVLMSDILINTSAQDKIIEFMIKEADKRDFAGWQFDFENINHLDRDLYTAFVAKTYAEMQKHDLEFSVAVVPRSVPYDPTLTNQDWSSGYDFAALSRHADFISLMSYDDPYSVGPVASLPFKERILGYMMTQIPPSKISLGIPLYCWKWDAINNKRVGSTTHKLAEEHYKKGSDKSRGYDPILASEWLRYTDKNGMSYVTWCESTESLTAKLDMIETYDLRGFSAWAIGQESTAWFWRLMKKY